ncbi:MAG: hypothetical protein JWQ15_882 [Marmoricola sp.]|nr:hypothetical protein [Marmoricola sp.]
MTTALAREEAKSTAPPWVPAARWLSGQAEHRFARYVVPALALVAVMVRLPFLAADPSRDEAGFLLVGQQWHSGGSSLYGDYWVDRPPLLITLFQAAAQLGGVVPLRLIGCVATVLVVCGTAYVARRIGGRSAAPWAALVAAALCVTPRLGGQAVNGELLSAPFVVAGIAAAVAAIDHANERRGALAAGLAGAATAAALLVKQNMADVAVFAAVALLVAWRGGELTTPRLVRSIVAAAAGAGLCTVVVALWTMAHGTSVAGVFDAMYPFRVEAGRVMAASDRTTANARLWDLLVSWVVCGGVVIMALVAWALLSSRLRGAAVWGLVATATFDVASIVLGGSYWNHYLIQLVVPVAVLAGLLISCRLPGARTVLTAVALSAAVALGLSVTGSQTTLGTSVGRAIGRASSPQDTIVTTWGHADITLASGLSCPYPYLWSLPARTLDPRLADLNALLSGPRAPTWFVTWTSVNTWGNRGGGAVTARLVAQHYRPVLRFFGHTVYLHQGVDRPVPALPAAGARPAASSASLATAAR